MKLDCLNMFRQLPPNSKNFAYVIFGGKLEYGVGRSTRPSNLENSHSRSRISRVFENEGSVWV